jgi:pimeloyl-ACP methyl ester carboxylesterase
MCARRFLLAVFVVILLAVAAGFVIFQFGNRVLLSEATPKGHFERKAAGGGPDYSRMESWVARPDQPNDPSRWAPKSYADGSNYLGFMPPPAIHIAAFYVHPTTYLDRDLWNAPLFPGGQTEFRTRLFVQSQASAFSDAAEVWAPRYRQAAYGAFLLRTEDAQRALDLAYSDVSAAFDAFLKRLPSNEPIILAGHSQGALHLMRLLEDRKAQLRGRLVAAYVVGWPISTTSDLPALGLPACHAPDQTGCILSWMSFAEPANPSLLFSDWRKTKGLTGGARKREDILCVNPITGTQNGAAPPEADPGTLVPTADFASAVLDRQKVGAHCDKGLLTLDGEIPALGPFVLPGNNYHVYDYALFWAAIARDAQRRASAWR